MKLKFQVFPPDSRPQLTPLESEEHSRAPLIVLHALFASARTWQSHARHLAHRLGRRVYALDLRNHGNSPHSSRMTYPEMAQDVVEFLDDESIGEAVLLGHSMGGKVAMTLALSHSQRCRALIVLDIAPVGYAGDYAEVFQALKAVARSKVSSRRAADALMQPLIPEPTTRQFLLTNLIRQSDNQTTRLVWRLNVDAIEKNMPALAAFPAQFGASNPPARYQGPTLFLRGERSHYITEAGLARIRHFFPQARIHTLKGAGHWINVDAGDAMLEEISTFLSET